VRFCDIFLAFKVMLLIMFAFVMDVVCKSSVDTDDADESIPDMKVLVCVGTVLVGAVCVNAVGVLQSVGVTVLLFCCKFGFIVPTIVVAVWAVACFLVERVLDIFFVVASNFDTRVVTVFVVFCAAVVCFVVDWVDVATDASVFEFGSDGDVGDVVVVVVSVEVGFVNVPVDSTVVDEIVVVLDALNDEAVVISDFSVTVDNILFDVVAGAIVNICL